MSALRKLALAVALVYLAACAAAWTMQRQLVFHPSVGGGQDPASRGLPFTDLTLTTSDGERLHGWYLPAPADAAAPRHILFLHGNAGNVSHRLTTLEVLHGLGHAVLIIDYRGYGRSSGQPSEAGTYLDAEAAWRYLRDERGINADDIVIYGRSLGGAVAATLAQGRTPRGVILESTFTSLADMGGYRYPWLPIAALLAMDYDTATRVATLGVPLLVAHSPDDEVVPYAMGRALADRAPGRVAFVSLKGSHNRAFITSGAAYHARLDRFIREAD